MGRPRVDFVIYSADEQPQLVIEVKATRAPTTDEWASQLRRNLAVHDFLPAGVAFMLALPHRLHLWRDGGSQDLTAPDFSIPAEEVLGSQWGAQLEQLSEESLLLIIRSWLSELIEPSTGPGDRLTDWLTSAGLLSRIRHGRVSLEAA
jgi:hypothetical protein